MMLKKIINHLPVLLLYLVGMGGFVLSDLIVAKYYSINDVEIWAFAKSVLLLSASLCILGLDQVVIRDSGAFKLIWRFLVIRAIILASGIALILWSYISDVSYLTWFFIILGLTFLSFMSALYRGALKMFRAQLSLNGWKLYFLIIVSLSIGVGVSIDYIILLSILIAVIVTFIFIAIRKDLFDFYFNKKAENSKNKIVSQSYKFVLLTISLNLSINFEQLAINMLGGGNNSVNVFAHFTVFLPFVVFLNGFVGFYLGPLLRKYKNVFDICTYRKLRFWFVILCLLLGLLSFSVGFFGFSFMYGDKYNFSYGFSICVVLIGMFRLLYSLPSAYISILGGDDILKLYCRVNIMCLFICLILVALFINLGFDVAYTVLVFSLLNWMLRVLFGNYLSISELKNVRS
ncbi:hypothetical protein AB4349_14015 [Vibrio breoganii]